MPWHGFRRFGGGSISESCRECRVGKLAGKPGDDLTLVERLRSGLRSGGRLYP
jgi:hypothetical protein